MAAITVVTRSARANSAGSGVNSQFQVENQRPGVAVSGVLPTATLSEIKPEMLEKSPNFLYVIGCAFLIGFCELYLDWSYISKTLLMFLCAMPACRFSFQDQIVPHFLTSFDSLLSRSQKSQKRPIWEFCGTLFDKTR